MKPYVLLFATACARGYINGLPMDAQPEAGPIVLKNN
jgi:hypothetical protein